jgi:hypothetical protein
MKKKENCTLAFLKILYPSFRPSNNIPAPNLLERVYKKNLVN